MTQIIIFINILFFEVLATGLSGLFSDLPTSLDIPSEDWYSLERGLWATFPELVAFLTSLEFCNNVIQVNIKWQGYYYCCWCFQCFIFAVLYGPLIYLEGGWMIWQWKLKVETKLYSSCPLVWRKIVHDPPPVLRYSYVQKFISSCYPGTYLVICYFKLLNTFSHPFKKGNY